MTQTDSRLVFLSFGAAPPNSVDEIANAFLTVETMDLYRAIATSAVSVIATAIEESGEEVTPAAVRQHFLNQGVELALQPTCNDAVKTGLSYLAALPPAWFAQITAMSRWVLDLMVQGHARLHLDDGAQTFSLAATADGVTLPASEILRAIVESSKAEAGMTLFC